MLTKTPAFRLAAGAAALFAAGCSSNMMMGSSPAPAMMSGGALVAPSGMTLYTFDKDVDAGKSNCNGPCATLWPPLMASATDKPTGAYTIIKRDDGSMQWAYKGKPVYTYKDDKKAGDRSGDNFKDNWHIITQ
jgi:predicted lipoprotein with Yx(FWY)xxD motif